jgi:hypothetical protein
MLGLRQRYRRLDPIGALRGRTFKPRSRQRLLMQVLKIGRHVARKTCLGDHARLHTPAEGVTRGSEGGQLKKKKLSNV